MFLDPIGVMQIRRDQHESEIGLRRDDAESEQLRVLQRAHFLHERGKPRFRLTLFLGAQQLPLTELNSVKQMQAVPALFWNERVALFVRNLRGVSAARRSGSRA